MFDQRVASLLVVSLVGLSPAAGAFPPEPDCPTVVRAWFSERAQVDELARSHEPWEVSHDEGWLLIGVDADGFDRLLELGFEVAIDERRTEQVCRPFEALEGQLEGIPGFPCYRTVEETFAAAAALAATRPDLAEWIDAGDSWEKTEPGLTGYDMMVLKLTNSAVAGTPTGVDPPHGKPRLFVTSAIHARELATAELMMRFAERLMEGHGVDPDATWVLDEHEIHLMLLTNPDGRKHAETGDLWRKNTNQNYCSPTSSDRGADLNRNFEFQWACCGGSSGYDCDETYRGPAPESEPETQAVRAWAQSIFPDQRDPALGAPAPADATGVYLDIHAHGRLVLWPWGFTSTPPPNGSALRTFGRKLAWFNGYSPEQAIGLYPADGTTIDSAYGERGVAAALFELGTWFFEDCGSFESTILPDNLAALTYAAKIARTPYLTPSGPEATSIDLGGVTVVAPGEPVTLTGVIDDTRFNMSNGTEPTQNIAGASYSVDAPPWRDGAIEHPMAALDGSFDSPTEAVTATVDTIGLAEGRHSLFVSGRDETGQQGTIAAAFFWVLDPATAARIAGRVRSTDDSSPLAATVEAGVFSTTSDPLDGSYELMVTAGSHDVIATAAGHVPFTVTGVTTIPGTVTPLDLYLAPYVEVFSDDVESGILGWTVESAIPGGDNWAIVTDPLASSPTHSWHSSDHSSIKDDRLISDTLKLGEGSATISFWHHFEFESGWDGGVLEVSTDGSSWSDVLDPTVRGVFLEGGYNGALNSSSNPLAGRSAWTGGSNTLERVVVDISSLAGQDIWFRFRLGCDGSVGDPGWWIDDIVVRVGGNGYTGTVFADGFESGDTSAWSITVE